LSKSLGNLGGEIQVESKSKKTPGGTGETWEDFLREI